MKNKEKQKKSIAPFIAIFIIGIIGAFALGYMVKDLAGEEPAPAEPEDNTVEVVLQDGTTLGARLKKLEDSINQANTQTLAALKKDLSKMSLNRRVVDISAGMPAQVIDLKNSGRYPSKGPDDAVVTLLEFSDFQCPHCRNMALYLEKLSKEFPEDVRIIFVDRPLASIHPLAQIGHEAAVEAGVQGKFWEMFIYIFTNQQKVFPRMRINTKEDLEKGMSQVIENLAQAAEELGLDKEKMRQSLEKRTHKNEVDKNNEMAKSLNINSTPTVFMDAFFLLKDPGAIPAFLDNAVNMK